jgi:hypothetical protein
LCDKRSHKMRGGHLISHRKLTLLWRDLVWYP